MTDPAHDQRQRMIGIALMCGAVLLFACLDAMAKWLGGHLHPFQVTGMRYISAFFIALIFLNPFTRPNILKTTQPRMQFLDRKSTRLNSSHT